MPSGTARELAETLGQVREPARAVPPADLEGPAEARGAEVGARVHSVRLPGFVVSTEVVFAGPGERLAMRHDPGLTPRIRLAAVQRPGLINPAGRRRRGFRADQLIQKS